MSYKPQSASSRAPVGLPTVNARIAIHVALVGVILWLAVVMSLPGNTFAQGHGWDGFAALASEETWAIVFACIGLLSGAWIGSPFAYARFLSVVLITSAHGSIALMMLRAAPVGSGAGTYGILAGLGYYLLWRQVRGEN